MTEPRNPPQHTPARRTSGLKKVAIVTVVALAAGVGAVAWADGRMGGCGGPGGHGMMGGGPGMMWDGGRMSQRMLDGLDATDAQRAQIRQIMHAAAADMKTQFEAGRALRQQGLAIFGAPSVDPAAVESLRQKMVAHYDQMSQKMTQTMVAVANVLTPEQRAKFAERMNKRGVEWRDRMQRHQGASAPTS